MREQAKRRGLAIVMASILVSSGALAGVAGVLWYRDERERSLQNAELELGLIADTRVRQIERWLDERRRDLNLISFNPYGSSRGLLLSLKLRGEPGPLREWLDLQRAAMEARDILLVDASGAILAAAGESPPDLGGVARANLDKALETGAPVISNLHVLHTGSFVHLDGIAPLCERPRAGPPLCKGALLARIDPTHAFFPEIAGRTASKSSREVVLVRRDGGYAVSVGRGAMRRPLNQPDLPAARALSGISGIFRGREQTGIPVVAATRTLLGGSLGLIAKQEIREFEAPILRRAAEIAAGSFAVFAAAGLLVSLLWLRRESRHTYERYLGEREKRALLQHFEYLTRYANDLILLADDDLRIVEANDRACSAFGYSREEMLSLRLWDLRPEDRRADLPDRVLSWRTGPVTYETVHRRKDGSVFPSEVQARRVQIDGRDYFQGILRDLSERNAARFEIAAQEARLRAFFESDAVGILFGDIDGGVHEANEAFLRIVGYARQELDQRLLDWTRLTPEEWLPVDERHILEARERGVCTPYEKQYRRRDGSLIWVLVGYALLEPDRRQSVAFIVDIDARKRAESRLRDSEERFRSLIEEAPVPMLALTDQGQTLTASAGWTEQIGYTLQELRDLPSWAERALRRHELFLELARASFDDAGTVARGVWTVQARDGSERIWDLSTKPLGKIGGERILLIVGSDITERTEAERRLQTVNAELEVRVHERTGDLKAANAELQSFSYSVSHDLRAPLRGIDGWSLALVEDYASALDDDGRKMIDRIRSEAQRMGQLIDDLLMLSRVGQAELHRSRVDVTRLALAVVHRIRERDPGRAAEVSVEEGLFADADPKLLDILLTNLIENAWKFTGKREPAQIRVRREGADAVAIEDNGEGFDMRYAGKLFQPFQRLHRASEFAGTGIGLATVKRIVGKHGGTISAEADLGRGARFVFTLGKAT